MKLLINLEGYNLYSEFRRIFEKVRAFLKPFQLLLVPKNFTGGLADVAFLIFEIIFLKYFEIEEL